MRYGRKLYEWCVSNLGHTNPECLLNYVCHNSHFEGRKILYLRIPLNWSSKSFRTLIQSAICTCTYLVFSGTVIFASEVNNFEQRITVLEKLVPTNNGLSLIIGATIALLSSLFTLVLPKIWQWFFRARLILHIDATDPRYNFHLRAFGIPQRSIKYLRLSIKNCGRYTAKRCQVDLARIETKARNDTNFEDQKITPVPLKWSYLGADSLEIHRDQMRFVDILKLEKPMNAAESTTLGPNFCDKMGARELELFYQDYIYRIFLTINADELKPKSIVFELHWTGNFEDAYNVTNVKSGY